MTSRAASKPPQPRQPNWRLMLPFALIGLAAIALCATLGFVLAQQGDQHLQAQRRAAVMRLIAEFRTVFAEITVHRAQDIATAPASSPAALAGLLVPSGLAHYRADATYVLDRAGQLVVSVPPGASELPPELARFVESNVVGGVGPGGAGPHTDYVLFGDKPAVAALTPLTRGAAVRPGDVLLAVVRLDERFIPALEKTAGIEAPSVEAGAAAGDREMLSLVDQGGRIVGWIGWRAQQPMSSTMIWLVPFLGLIALWLIGFAAHAFRQVCRTNDHLEATRAEAERIANEDPLTGLANRRRILEELDRALAARRTGRYVCFAFLDLDGFKDVNEALGHEAGDQLLIYVAERLTAATTGLGTLGRIGGDEFAMVIDADDAKAATWAVNAAIAAMAQPFWLAGQALQVGLTVGLAQGPQHGETRDELTRRADLALRTAKRHGRGRAVAFEPEMEGGLNERRFVNRELRHTLAEGGLDVHYQPIVAADGQRVVGVEALARWKHPERGDIPPMVFIPVAEQTGLMPKLGEFVLRRALSDALRWKDVYIAVNLSPVQVRDRNLVDLVRSVIAETGIEPGRVVLEITEGVLIENPEEAQLRLENLRALGVKIAIDDFGSGYSSLSYLRRFPIDKLKIDKEFVSPLGRSANGGVIIQAIIALGRALGLSVLCEGVETEEQRILLRLAGCDEMQGYLFARPGPAAGVDRLLAPAADARARRLGRAEA